MSGVRLLVLLLCSWLLTPDSCYAQQQGAVRLGPLAPGLACNPSVYNPGTAPVTADCTITPQLFYEAHTASCTINSTCGSANDSGKLLTSTGAAGAVTFTLPAPGAPGAAGYTFGYAGNSYLLASSASIYGCGTAGTLVTLTYGASVAPDGTGWQCTPYGATAATSSVFFQQYMAGLIPSNDGTTPATVFDVTAGVAADDTNVLMMVLSSAFKKSIPGTIWAAGTGNSCQDVAGAMVASQWYYIYLISNAAGTTVDILCSAAKPVSPWTGTFPTGYTLKRWIGEVATSATPAIRAFQTLDGHLYKWQAPGFQGSTVVGNSQLLMLLDVPLGIAVEPLCRVSMTGGSPPVTVVITDPYVTDQPPPITMPFAAAPGWDEGIFSSGQVVTNGACPPGIMTNITGQIALHASAASTTVNFVTKGWRQ